MESVWLPFHPIPLGLTLNTVLYGLLWYVLIAMPRQLLRSLRHRAGKCVKCKYDLSGSEPGEPCPECGSPIPAR